jgi:RNA polymerase sigma-70 factor, ECF subfamily
VHWDWELVLAECTREARRVARSRADADDVAQEAALRAWRMRGSCRSADDPGPWLRAITRNEAHRMRTRRAATSELPAAELPDRPADTEEDAILLRIAMEEALEQLPATDRLMLRLRYEDDLTNPAIAATLGLSVTNVKVRLHRVRARLERALPTP